MKVHRAVLNEFVGPCPKDMETCHADGDKENNRLENLRYDTHRNNELDKINHGTFGKKLSVEDVRYIRKNFIPRRNAGKLAEMFGVRRNAIYNIVNGRTWKQVK